MVGVNYFDMLGKTRAFIHVWYNAMEQGLNTAKHE
jgi:hypothetical protein